MAFAGFTLLTAAALVGTDKDEGVISAAADRMTDPAGTEPQDYSEGLPADIADLGQDVVAFAADDDLIDDAEGLDPTPMSDTPDPVLLDAGPSTGDTIEPVAEPGAGDRLPADERRYELLE
ncbi:hypothetical protein [Pseudopontixanthobacter vadosimaris]|uniref:hypothetical protein n=1 Tax=Pseudopontixanthobacter vadosimaris TaxID=2726450 RepID=UPI0014760FC4|nr:hypothetical protein [Pseudopontixanthobacter vadosimaris]